MLDSLRIFNNFELLTTKHGENIKFEKLQNHIS